MEFDHKKLDLPFHPGDSLFWVDTDDGFKVKEEKNAICAVVIYPDEIKLWEYNAGSPETPNSDNYCFLKEEDAQAWAKAQQSTLKASEIDGEPGKWYDPRKHVPKKREGKILVYKNTNGFTSMALSHIPDNPVYDMADPSFIAWTPIADVPFFEGGNKYDR